jgi:hypothetical protein
VKAGPLHRTDECAARHPEPGFLPGLADDRLLIAFPRLDPAAGQ